MSRGEWSLRRALRLCGTTLLVAACSDEATQPPDPVASVAVSPDAGGVVLGHTLQLTAKVHDAAGKELVDRPVTWASSAPPLASVSSTGLVTGLALGDSVVITATSQGKSDTATVSVVMDIAGEWNFTDQYTVWWFSVGNPIQGVYAEAVSCSDTGSFQFSQSGAEISGTMSLSGTCLGHPRPQVPLGSWDNTAGPLSIAGHLSATHISFAVGGGCSFQGDITGPPTPKLIGTYPWCPVGNQLWLKGSWEATPGGAPVASLAVRWDAHILAGGAFQLVPVLRDAASNVLSRNVTWAGDNPSVAAVSGDGLVTALAAGSGRITATSGGMTGSASITADLVSFRSVSAGVFDGCAVTTTGAAYCWGFGGDGQLGTGFRNLLREPLASMETPEAVAGGHSFELVSAGAFHSCGITPAHDAYCWGDNSHGQLGDGSTTSSLAPVRVTGGHQFASVTVGNFHSCGLTTANEVYCWGNNEAGQLGGPGGSSSPAPVLVGGGSLLFQAVRAGRYHNCGVTLTQEAYCWGYNHDGQVGNGTTSFAVTSPVQVTGGHSLVAVGAGFSHSCGVASDGTAYCWGDGSLIGDGSFNGVSPTPRAVTGGPFATADSALGVGDANSCALTLAGAAYCWGHNNVGELGDGSTVDRTTPVQVSGGHSFAAISVGAFFTCGVTSASVALCWGDNDAGRLGAHTSDSCVVDQNGTTLPCATAPVPVIGQSQIGIAAARSSVVEERMPRAAFEPLLLRRWRGQGLAPVSPSLRPPRR